MGGAIPVVSPEGPSEHQGATRDFRIPGVFHVRVTEGRPENLRAVRRAVGAPGPVRPGEPDVRVTFADQIPLPEGLRLIDGGRAGFVEGEGDVYLLDAPDGGALARVAQKGAWGRAKITCLRGAKTIPGLAAALDLAALSRGWIPLHGSAWTDPDGACTVLAGWGRSGKTGGLLAACARGATAIGDDRVLLSRDGQEVVGTGRDVVVKGWHREQIDPSAFGVRPSGSPIRSTVARIASATARTLPRSEGGPVDWTSATRKVLERAARMSELEVDPMRLGAGDGGRPRARPHVLVVLETHDRPTMSVEPVASERAAEMVAAQVDAELRDAVRLQAVFDYAAPGLGWRGVERSTALARELLAQALASLPCRVVRHPYPCRLSDLRAALSIVAASVHP